jgi:hypothetical protein
MVTCVHFNKYINLLKNKNKLIFKKKKKEKEKGKSRGGWATPLGVAAGGGTRPPLAFPFFFF